MDWLAHLGVAWLVLAVLLALAELAAPGVFLIFIAVAAGITGLLTLLFPALGLAGGLVSFGAWSVVSVLIGKRWYGNDLEETSDPLLNDPAARLIGREAVVVEWNERGSGRAQLGDSVWPARGDGLSIGMAARVDHVEDGTLILTPLPAIPSP